MGSGTCDCRSSSHLYLVSMTPSLRYHSYLPLEICPSLLRDHCLSLQIHVPGIHSFTNPERSPPPRHTRFRSRVTKHFLCREHPGKSITRCALSPAEIWNIVYLFERNSPASVPQDHFLLPKKPSSPLAKPKSVRSLEATHAVPDRVNLVLNSVSKIQIT